MDQKEMHNVLGLQTNLGPRTAKLETVTSHTDSERIAVSKPQEKLWQIGLDRLFIFVCQFMLLKPYIVLNNHTSRASLEGVILTAFLIESRIDLIGLDKKPLR